MASAKTEPDLSEFKALNTQKRMSCSVSKAVELLSVEDRPKFEAALAEPSIMHSAISDWLRLRGIAIAEQTVGRHRRGRCSCDG